MKIFWVDCLCNSKIISTFAIVNEPTREGEAIDVVVGGVVYEIYLHIRRHIYALAWHFGIW